MCTGHDASLSLAASAFASGLGMVRGSAACPRKRAELLQQPLHIYAEAVVLDLESVPRRVLPADAMADIGRCARFQLAEPGGALRIGCPAP